jgi:hypothetical protein
MESLPFVEGSLDLASIRAEGRQAGECLAFPPTGIAGGAPTVAKTLMVET